MATIKDLARRTGLSITTVSRALNNYDDVAAETRKRVHQAAAALDYHPNLVARGLQGMRTGTIGLMIPLVVHRAYDAFWLEFIGGAAATCTERGVDLLVATSESRDGNGRSLQRLVRGRRVDGLLICEVRTTDPRIGELRQRGLPFVAFGRTTRALDYSYIDVDGAAGVSQAVDHLVGLGHRCIAYFGLDPSFGYAHYRLEGYRRGLQAAGLPCDERFIYQGMTEYAVAGTLDELLAQEPAPTAILASADFLAVATLKAALARGLEVPSDLSIVAFDDSPLVQHVAPPLSAVSQPNRRIGEEAAALLLDRIDDPARPLMQRLIVPNLILRHSTAPPPRT